MLPPEGMMYELVDVSEDGTPVYRLVRIPQLVGKFPKLRRLRQRRERRAKRTAT
jgi:hypothetical protein